MFRNSFAKERNEAGDLIFPISTYGATTTAEIVEWANVPENIKSTVPAKFKAHGGMTPNAIHLIFSSEIDPSYWLPSNPVAGRFAGGFGHVYVVAGSMSGYQAGEFGPRIENRDRNSSAWHIVLVYGASRGAEVYLFAPFVVAGFCNSAYLVQFIPTQTGSLNCNIS
jgi:hypothetical protein